MDKRDYVLNATCPRCGGWLMLSPVDEYSLCCPNCEEDFYSFEVNQIYGDWFEITIFMSYSQFENILEPIKENFKDTCFVGYDDEMRVCDIGFETIPNSKRVKDIIKFFNLIKE